LISSGYISTFPKRSETDKITFKYNDKTIHLLTDPNDLEIWTYKRIRALCIKHKIEFKNQSFAQFITQLKTLHFDNSKKRQYFSKDQRDAIP